jgi:hypothetical protein
LNLLEKAHRHFEGRFDAAFARWGLTRAAAARARR